MKELACVEVIVEKERYAQEGVHKGMNGWICHPECVRGYWLVNFPQYGEKDDIAEIDIKEEDMKEVPVMNVKINEQIRAEFDALERDAEPAGAEGAGDKTKELSFDLI